MEARYGNYNAQGTRMTDPEARKDKPGRKKALSGKKVDAALAGAGIGGAATAGYAASRVGSAKYAARGAEQTWEAAQSSADKLPSGVKYRADRTAQDAKEKARVARINSNKDLVARRAAAGKKATHAPRKVNRVPGRSYLQKVGPQVQQPSMPSDYRAKVNFATDRAGRAVKASGKVRNLKVATGAGLLAAGGATYAAMRRKGSAVRD